MVSVVWPNQGCKKCLMTGQKGGGLGTLGASVIWGQMDWPQERTEIWYGDGIAVRPPEDIFWECGFEIKLSWLLFSRPRRSQGLLNKQYCDLITY